MGLDCLEQDLVVGFPWKQQPWGGAFLHVFDGPPSLCVSGLDFDCL